MDKLPFEQIEREILVKKESINNPEFGCAPDKRSIEELLQNSVITLNKPAGPR